MSRGTTMIARVNPGRHSLPNVATDAASVVKRHGKGERGRERERERGRTGDYQPTRRRDPSYRRDRLRLGNDHVGCPLSPSVYRSIFVVTCYREVTCARGGVAALMYDCALSIASACLHVAYVARSAGAGIDFEFFARLRCLLAARIHWRPRVGHTRKRLF